MCGEDQHCTFYLHFSAQLQVELLEYSHLNECFIDIFSAVLFQSASFWHQPCQITLELCTSGAWHCQLLHKVTAVLQYLLFSCAISEWIDGCALVVCVRIGFDCLYFVLSLPIALWKVYRAWDCGYHGTMPSVSISVLLNVTSSSVVLEKSMCNERRSSFCNVMFLFRITWALCLSYQLTW